MNTNGWRHEWDRVDRATKLIERCLDSGGHTWIKVDDIPGYAAKCTRCGMLDSVYVQPRERT